jgi:ribA/ribD-fused uncharacterized protein
MVPLDSWAHATTEVRFYRATGQYGFLSNLYPATVSFDEREFPTSEHAYQYGKFRNPIERDWAMTAPNPCLVAIVAHNLFAWQITEGWTAIKVERMRQVLYAKFTQHADLQAQLLATFPAVIIESSGEDAFWGIGKKGNGKNMLGHLLMELRLQLQNK